MGEVANMMLEGTLCCQCGECLEEEVIEQELGFPIICDSCYEELPEERKADYKDRRESIFLKS